MRRKKCLGASSRPTEHGTWPRTLMMAAVSGNTNLSLVPATNGPVSQFIQHLFQLSRGVISGVLEWTIDYYHQLRADKWTVATLLALHTTPATLCTALCLIAAMCYVVVIID